MRWVWNFSSCNRFVWHLHCPWSTCKLHATTCTIKSIQKGATARKSLGSLPIPRHSDAWLPPDRMPHHEASRLSSHYEACNLTQSEPPEQLPPAHSSRLSPPQVLHLQRVWRPAPPVLPVCRGSGPHAPTTHALQTAHRATPRLPHHPRRVSDEALQM